MLGSDNGNMFGCTGFAGYIVGEPSAVQEGGDGHSAGQERAQVSSSDPPAGTTEDEAHEDAPAPEQAPPEATRAARSQSSAGSDLWDLGLVLFVHEGPRRRTLHAARRDDAGEGARLACGILKSRTSEQDVASVRYDAVCLRYLRGAAL